MNIGAMAKQQQQNCLCVSKSNSQICSIRNYCVPKYHYVVIILFVVWRISSSWFSLFFSLSISLSLCRFFLLVAIHCIVLRQSFIAPISQQRNLLNITFDMFSIAIESARARTYTHTPPLVIRVQSTMIYNNNNNHNLQIRLLSLHSRLETKKKRRKCIYKYKSYVWIIKNSSSRRSKCVRHSSTTTTTRKCIHIAYERWRPKDKKRHHK